MIVDWRRNRQGASPARSAPAAPGSDGPILARELLLLGAESVAATPPDRVVAAGEEWPVLTDRWRALADATEAWEEGGDGDPLHHYLRGELGLGRLATWLVLACAAVELHPEAAAAASLLAEDERLHLPTAAGFARLAHQAFGAAPGEAMVEALGGAAVRLGLVVPAERATGRPATQQGLQLAPAELPRFLHPQGAGEPSGAAVAAERRAPAEEPANDRHRIAALCDLLAERGVVCLRGTSHRALLQAALDVAAVAALPSLRFAPDDAEELPPAALLLRSALVGTGGRGGAIDGGGLPVLDLHRRTALVRGPVPGLRGLASELRALRRRGAPGLLVLVGAEADTGDLPAVAVPPLDHATCVRIWRGAGCDEEAAQYLARRYRIDGAEVQAAVAEARDELRLAGAGSGGEAAGPGTAEAIGRAVRDRGARRMGAHTERVESEADLGHLVVPSALRRQIDDVLGWYRSSARVFGEMAMGRSTRLGRGLVCLFSGPSGTGKTFAAQCLANELELELYRIDLSKVVSKYIGETEKALSAVFDEAEAGHGILLFDEADSLFGKRSAVKDAHDRYANIEVGYLLQRIEAFDGMAILATNLRNNLDTAFIRRIRFLLDFPMPDAAMRRRLWEQSLPGAEHREPGLPLDLLAERFRLSGGSIHGIGLAAAHLAAATPSGRVTAGHLVAATHRELAKAGLARTSDDFGELAAWLDPEIAGGSADDAREVCR